MRIPPINRGNKVTCKGVMCTQKHLGIDTAQVKSLCKSIIKMCDEQPHSVDSLLEQAYVELSTVAMMMKKSADRARDEQAVAVKRHGDRAFALKHCDDKVTRYPSNFTTPRLQKMLEEMSPEKLEEIMTRVAAKRG